MYKVQVHQFWYEIRFWGTKVHVFSSFLSTENKFNGGKRTQLKIQKIFYLTKLCMSKNVFRTSKIPCFCLLEKAIFHSWKSKSFEKTRTLVSFCTSNVLYCTWVKISGTKYKVQYKYRYKYMYILRWRMNAGEKSSKVRRAPSILASTSSSLIMEVLFWLPKTIELFRFATFSRLIEKYDPLQTDLKKSSIFS